MRTRGIVWSYTILGDAANVHSAGMPCVVAVAVASGSVIVLGHLGGEGAQDPVIGMAVESDGEVSGFDAGEPAGIQSWRRVLE